MRNPAQFHRADGLGYEYVMDKIIELDSLNPQIASRIVSAFNLYSKLVPSLQEKMKVQLDKLMSKKDISKNVEEIASKILASV